jgi:hypothetical protein
MRSVGGVACLVVLCVRRANAATYWSEIRYRRYVDQSNKESYQAYEDGDDPALEAWHGVTNGGDDAGRQ